MNWSNGLVTVWFAIQSESFKQLTHTHLFTVAFQTLKTLTFTVLQNTENTKSNFVFFYNPLHSNLHISFTSDKEVLHHIQQSARTASEWLWTTGKDQTSFNQSTIQTYQNGPKVLLLCFEQIYFFLFFAKYLSCSFRLLFPRN